MCWAGIGGGREFGGGPLYNTRVILIRKKDHLVYTYLIYVQSSTLRKVLISRVDFITL